MNYKLVTVFILCFTLFNCGTTHHVVNDDGKVYKVKGNNIHHKGEEITDDLSRAEKKQINALVDDKLETEKSTSKQLKALEKEQEELEKIEEEAEKKRKALEEEQEELEREKKRREKIKQDYLDAQEKLQDQTKKYERLLKKGKLDERDVKKWKEKIRDLEEEVIETKKAFDKLSNGK